MGQCRPTGPQQEGQEQHAGRRAPIAGLPSDAEDRRTSAIPCASAVQIGPVAALDWSTPDVSAFRRDTNLVRPISVEVRPIATDAKVN